MFVPEADHNGVLANRKIIQRQRTVVVSNKNINVESPDMPSDSSGSSAGQIQSTVCGDGGCLRYDGLYHHRTSLGRIVLTLVERMYLCTSMRQGPSLAGRDNGQTALTQANVADLFAVLAGLPLSSDLHPMFCNYWQPFCTL